MQSGTTVGVFQRNCTGGIAVLRMPLEPTLPAIPLVRAGNALSSIPSIPEWSVWETAGAWGSYP